MLSIPHTIPEHTKNPNFKRQTKIKIKKEIKEEPNDDEL